MTQGYAEFEFDLPEALLERLVRRFEEIEPAPLLKDRVAEVPEAQGVYQLLLGDQIVYIGKTDAAKGLRQRLERHAATIQHRRNLDPARVQFRAIRVFVFTAMDLEAQLISHYGGVSWQHSGFGSNDPGRNRDGTRLKPGGFDERFPINLDHEIGFDLPASAPIRQLLTELKSNLPYIFRYQPLSGDIASKTATLPAGALTTRSVISAIVNELPAGWQATDMFARLILYPETREYEHGLVVCRSPGGE